MVGGTTTRADYEPVPNKITNAVGDGYAYVMPCITDVKKLLSLTRSSIKKNARVTRVD